MSFAIPFTHVFNYFLSSEKKNWQEKNQKWIKAFLEIFFYLTKLTLSLFVGWLKALRALWHWDHGLEKLRIITSIIYHDFLTLQRKQHNIT